MIKKRSKVNRKLKTEELAKAMHEEYRCAVASGECDERGTLVSWEGLIHKGRYRAVAKRLLKIFEIRPLTKKRTSVK